MEDYPIDVGDFNLEKKSIRKINYLLSALQESQDSHIRDQVNQAIQRINFKAETLLDDNSYLFNITIIIDEIQKMEAEYFKQTAYWYAFLLEMGIPGDNISPYADTLYFLSHFDA